jgi:hypothetical protein
MATSWWNRFFKSMSRPAPRGSRGRPARKPLLLEQLEDRVVPTITFAPRAGVESIFDFGGQRLVNTTVHLIFWGSGWANSPATPTTDVSNAVSRILSGPYLSHLAQYSAPSGGTLGNAQLGVTTTDLSNPGAQVNDQGIQGAVQRAISSGAVPAPSSATTPLYVVFTLPGVNLDDPTVAQETLADGYHSSSNFSVGSLSRLAQYVWVGFTPADPKTGPAAQDQITRVFSHEVAEAITDANPLRPVLPLGIRTITPDGTRNEEICDSEAANYTARINGDLVQSYWSKSEPGIPNSAYVIPANGPDLTVDSSGQLHIKVDQVDLFHNTLTLQLAGTTGTNFERVTLNGCSIDLTVGELSGIVVSAPTGSDTINVENNSFNTPITINLGSGTSTVNIAPVGEALDGIPFAGAPNVTVNGKSGAGDTLNVYDRNAVTPGSPAFPVKYNLLGSSINREFGANRTGIISYTGMSAVNLFGVNEALPGQPAQAPATYTISNTASGCATQVDTGTDLATVQVNATAANSILTIVGRSPGDLVTIGNGLMQAIQGTVSVTNPPSRTHLVLDDSQDTVGNHQVSLSADSVNGRVLGLSAPILYLVNDVSAVDVKGGTGGDAWTVNGTAANFSKPVTTLSAGSGNDIINVQATSGALTVFGSTSGSCTVTLGKAGSVQSINGTVTINNVLLNSPNNADLIIDDSADATGRVATLAIIPGPGPAPALGKISGLLPSGADILYGEANIDSLVVKGGVGADTFTVSGTMDRSPTTLSVGQGADAVTVKATGDAGLTVIGSTSGNDTVTVGDDGSLQNIFGTVLVKNPPSFTHLIVDGSADTAPLNATLSVTPIPGSSLKLGRIAGLTPPSAEIDYAEGDISSLDVKAGQGGGSITVANTMGTPGSPRTTALGLGAGGFAVNVQGTAGALTINGGSGNDTFNVGSTANTLDPIQGPVTVNGQGGFDTLNINDQGSTTPHDYTQTATTFSRDGAATITFSSIESLQPHKGIVLGSAPMATDLAFTSSIRAGQFATLSGRLIDADAGDRLSLIVDWGDGSRPAQLTPDRAPFSLKHKYKHPGTYTVRAIWTDSTGQSNSRDLTLTVTAAP